MIREYLINRKEELQRSMNDISCDFTGDYDATSSDYLCDAIMDYADNNVDLYYGNLVEWFKDNYDYVENAIDEYGDVARDSHGKPDIMRTIQQGQFYYNEEKLNEDIENIIEILAINYILENLKEERTEEEYEELQSNLSIIDRDDSIEEIKECCDKFIKGDNQDECIDN